MDAENSVGVAIRHVGGDTGTPIAALHEVARVAEQLDHQRAKLVSYTDRPDHRADGMREGEARQRWDDDIVPVGDERRNEVLKLDEGAGPAMEKQEGRLGSVTRGVDDMNALAFDFSRERGKAVQAELLSTPVKAFQPVADQPSQVGLADARCPTPGIREQTQT